jgi:hypothetical protein
VPGQSPALRQPSTQVAREGSQTSPAGQCRSVVQRPRWRQVPVAVSQKRAGFAQSALFSQPVRAWQKPAVLHSSPGAQSEGSRHSKPVRVSEQPMSRSTSARGQERFTG